MKFTELPVIGKPLAEGIFAGITSTKKGHFAVIKLPQEGSNLTHAKSQSVGHQRRRRAAHAPRGRHVVRQPEEAAAQEAALDSRHTRRFLRLEVALLRRPPGRLPQ